MLGEIPFYPHIDDETSLGRHLDISLLSQ
jgi:dethiobiotin synthetase